MIRTVTDLVLSSYSYTCAPVCFVVPVCRETRRDSHGYVVYSIRVAGTRLTFTFCFFSSQLPDSTAVER